MDGRLDLRSNLFVWRRRANGGRPPGHDRREFPDSVRQPGTVGDRLDAELCQEFGRGLSGGPDDTGAGESRKLDGEEADAAGGATDQNRVAGLESDPVDSGDGGQTSNGQRAGGL